jgi:hypothetical protein
MSMGRQKIPHRATKIPNACSVKYKCLQRVRREKILLYNKREGRTGKKSWRHLFNVNTRATVEKVESVFPHWEVSARPRSQHVVGAGICVISGKPKRPRQLATLQLVAQRGDRPGDRVVCGTYMDKD